MTVSPRPGIAERLARMIQLPTIAPSDGGDPAALHDFPALLNELYPNIATHLEKETVGGLGVLYRWRGTDPARDPLVLMAHYDVVPAHGAESWTHPPFDGVIADGAVWGRGTLDDKGPLIVAIEAVENLLSSGYRPQRDVYLSFGGDEETAGTAAAAIADLLASRSITPWLVLDEGGAVVDAPLPGITTDVAMIGLTEKGVLYLHLEATSSGGHASTPPAINAIARLARAVTRLRPTTFPARLSETASHMLRTFAPHARQPYRLLYTVLGRFPRLAGLVLSHLGPEAAAMTRTTLTPTVQAGGVAGNVLPPHATVTLNLRITPGENVADVVRRVRHRINDSNVTITVLRGDEPSPQSPTDDRFDAICHALTASHPGVIPVPYVMMAATDSRHFHRHFTHVYRFAPARLTATQRHSLHGVNEHVLIDELERGERFHRALIEQTTTASLLARSTRREPDPVSRTPELRR